MFQRPMTFLVASMTILALSPGAKAEWDSCAGNTDAGESWETASPRAGLGVLCRGAMAEGEGVWNDWEDWYKVNQPATLSSGGPHFQIWACTTEKTGGVHDIGVAIYFRSELAELQGRPPSYIDSFDAPDSCHGSTIVSADSSTDLLGGTWYVRLYMKGSSIIDHDSAKYEMALLS